MAEGGCQSRAGSVAVLRKFRGAKSGASPCVGAERDVGAPRSTRSVHLRRDADAGSVRHEAWARGARDRLRGGRSGAGATWPCAGERRVGHAARAGMRAGRRPRGPSAGRPANRGATGERPRQAAAAAGSARGGYRLRGRAAAPRPRPAWPRSRWSSRPSLRSRSPARTMLPERAPRPERRPATERPQPLDTRATVVGHPAGFASHARLPGAPASGAT